MNIKKALLVVIILILLLLVSPVIHIGSTDSGGLPTNFAEAATEVPQPEPTTTIDLSFPNTTTSTTRYTPPTVPQYRNTEIESPSNRWDQLAVCESSGNWSYPPVAGGFSGGIMFHIGTWRSMGGQEFAPDAYLASREQQIIVAERVLATSGWRAWPGCSRKFGWI